MASSRKATCREAAAATSRRTAAASSGAEAAECRAFARFCYQGDASAMYMYCTMGRAMRVLCEVYATVHEEPPRGLGAVWRGAHAAPRAPSPTPGQSPHSPRTVPDGNLHSPRSFLIFKGGMELSYSL